VENLAHSASFHSKENNAPSKPGIKQLGAPRLLRGRPPLSRDRSPRVPCDGGLIAREVVSNAIERYGVINPAALDHLRQFDTRT
jgi:hypothetical protein